MWDAQESVCQKNYSLLYHFYLVRSGCGSISIAHLVEVTYILLTGLTPFDRILAGGNTTDVLLLFFAKVGNEKAFIVSCLVSNSGLRVWRLVRWPCVHVVGVVKEGCAVCGIYDRRLELHNW